MFLFFLIASSDDIIKNQTSLPFSSSILRMRPLLFLFSLFGSPSFLAFLLAFLFSSIFIVDQYHTFF